MVNDRPALDDATLTALKERFVSVVSGYLISCDAASAPLAQLIALDIWRDIADPFFAEIQLEDERIEKTI
ncbi:MAG: hypothetical protein WDN04_04270 [Rhodospirillales bacterium]